MRGGFRYNPYRRNRWQQLLRHAIRPLLLIVIGFAVTQLFVLHTYTVTDASLQPVLQPGDVVLVALTSREPRFGEIVLFYPPYATPHTIRTRLRTLLQGPISRLFGSSGYPRYRHLPVLRTIAALPGEPITEQLFPLGEGADVPAGFPLSGSQLGGVVPDSHIAVSSSGGFLDSRHYGSIDSDAVRGIARWRIWPLDRIERLTPGNAP